LKEIKGWDEQALTEDTELTFRIYAKGYMIKFLPTATTWEQEPERLSTWVRQRTRWSRGNNYILATYGKKIFKTRPNITSVELLNLFYLYYFFIFAILFSDIIFLLSLFGLVHIRVVGPYSILWGLAFLLYALEVLIALSYEREDSASNLFLAILAYFSYTKLWVFVVLKSLFQDYVRKSSRTWDKTERFDIEPENKKKKMSGQNALS
jgi:cellulose synthase/poly-beta-1,6-N-acetylglucosamine synthase-like glycosyltransferase